MDTSFDETIDKQGSNKDRTKDCCWLAHILAHITRTAIQESIDFVGYSSLFTA